MQFSALGIISKSGISMAMAVGTSRSFVFAKQLKLSQM
jgi:hypothetical protein